MKVPAILVLAMAILSEAAIAQFHDQGLVNAKMRTDYNSQTEGTASNPITYVNPCLFSIDYCGNSPTVFSASNSFFQNTTSYPQSSYWVLDFNNENSWDKRCPLNPPPDLNCTPGQIVVMTNNPGPPNQSIPRASPGYGLMGFTAITNSLPGEAFYRAHLVMNGTFPNPNLGGIPFMAIGAERYRGNGAPVGYLNHSTAPKRAQFKARLWDFKLPTGVGTQPPHLTFYVYATTFWGGKARGLYVTLAHWNWDNSTSTGFTKEYKWNWPMQESFYFPGIEWVFIDAEDVQSHCGFTIPRLTTKNQQISYDINFQSLFQCLGSTSKNGWDSPFPTSAALAINGVHWSVEMTGVSGWIWPSVHDMKMVQ